MRLMLRLILAAGRTLLRTVPTRTIMRLVETYDLPERELLVTPHLLRTIYTCNQYLLHNGIVQEVVVVGDDPSWQAGASDRVGRC